MLPIPKRILAIHLKRVGDIILTLPAIRRLKSLFPQAPLDFLVDREFAPILEGDPNLNDIRLYPRERPWRLRSVFLGARYDWVIDFLADGASAWACFFSGAHVRAALANNYPFPVHNVKIPRPQKKLYSAQLKIHLIDELARRAGVEPGPLVTDDWMAKWRAPREKSDYWKEVLGRTGLLSPNGPLVMLSPQSRRATRRWSLNGFADVARRLAEERAARILCLWGPGERDRAVEVARLADHPNVRIAPQTRGLLDLGALLGHARLLVTNCNGTKHLAVALGLSTLTIHMSSDPASWNPPGPGGLSQHPRHQFIRMDKLWCIGCQKNECPYNLECSALLKPDDVAQAALRLLDDSSADANAGATGPR